MTSFVTVAHFGFSGPELICDWSSYQVFFGATPHDFTCDVPNVTSNFSGLPQYVSKLDWEKEVKVCHMYTLEDANSTLPSDRFNDTGLYKKEACAYGHNFSDLAYQSTVVTEYDLVCEDRIKGTLTFTMFTVGGVIGPLISGKNLPTTT